eukprot:TRINITY_DN28720_c0_g1_i2.p2 TRINITY_DN28720_c0_g1~~TRINITY_DN28720_c0_g1_i2.p2  ORF type:complete len:116 (+),score=16.07 TRINITY_DN28720_c0_g1_i2:181-528(+)
MGAPVAESAVQIAVRLLKFAGLFAGGIACLKTSIATIQPLTWDRWTLFQKALFRCLVPGLVSMMPAGKWFGSEGPSPGPYLGFMIAFAVLCLRRGFGQGLAIKAALGPQPTSCNY